jgi:hypothetical protein
MVRRGSFIGGQDNLSVPDAPTIGAATAGAGQVSVAFTAPSDVGDDPITSFGASVFPATGTTKTFRVTVASGNLYGGGTGNVFYIDGVSNPELTLVKGFTYVFDQEDSSNSSHPLHFKDTGGSQYTTGVTVSGTAGSSGATVTLVLAEDATEPSQYYCTSHGNGMGNLITLVAPSASDDPLGEAQYTNTGSSSPITVTGLSNGTSYVAKVWAINDYGNGPLSDATSSFTPALARALFTGMDSASRIDFITVTTTGNASDFGDVYTGTTQYSSAAGSDTRGILYHGFSGGHTNIISYVTIATTGNSTDFGDLTQAKSYTGSASNNVRSINAGGNDGSGSVNDIEYLTIASTGNGTDFGNLSASTRSKGVAGSTTRIVMGGGYTTSKVNTIDFVTIVSAANATDFGDLTVNRTSGALASSTRCVFGSGSGSSGNSNVMDYVTIASTGNATDFGDATVARDTPAGTGTATRGVFGGGTNVIEYITIASTGNATDFGDLHTSGTQSHGAHCSDTPAVQNEDGFPPAAMGLIMGGRYSYPGETHIGYVDIATTSNTISFGDLTTPRSQASGSASSTRAVSYTGYGQANGTTVTDIIEYVEFSTKGKATDFGNASATSYLSAAVSNGSRGVFALGYSGGFVNNIDYITFASAGNATDFGDLTVARGGMAGGMNSTTRGVFAGGFLSGENYIDYITIASTGNATDFGDLLNSVYRCGGGGSSTRGIVGGGYDHVSEGETNTIQYITIASTGNATDFGDLTDARHTYGGMSSSTRMIFGSDNRVSDSSDVLDYVTIASTGNATDFGDALIGIESAYTSNSHGGIS